jgi:hypothetical protein
MGQSHSQLGQDRKVVKYYNERRLGYYVDIGAGNGFHISNTFLLERKYAWTGICVEPVSKSYDQLVINRPNSICVNKAVYKSNGYVDFSVASNPSATAPKSP